jgi:hypothetical protein
MPSAGSISSIDFSLKPMKQSECRVKRPEQRSRRSTLPDRRLYDFWWLKLATVTRGLDLAWSSLCRSLEQRARLDTKNRRQLVDHHNRCAIDPAVERADVSTIDAGLISQCFLR